MEVDSRREESSTTQEFMEAMADFEDKLAAIAGCRPGARRRRG